MKLTRRHFLQGSMMATLALGMARPKLGLAARQPAPLLVLVTLRGAMDGLHFVPPMGDANYQAIREGQGFSLAHDPAHVLPLNGTDFFALHPSLTVVRELYNRKQLAIVHAVAPSLMSPEATDAFTRSHFDAQDMLDTGTMDTLTRQGWLNRLVGEVDIDAVGLQAALPLTLRGPKENRDHVSNWAFNDFAQLDPENVIRLQNLYRYSPAMLRCLEEAVHDDGIAADSSGNIAEAAVKFLLDEDGPNVAMIELGGWDHHAEIFKKTSGETLNTVLGILATGLAGVWNNTLVVVMTEFGRAARPNGARGTDHGTGGVAFIMGGDIMGGRVLTDWPGLAPAQLFENRDLKPTVDLRAFIRQPLQSMFGLSNAQIESILPGIIGVPPFSILR